MNKYINWINLNINNIFFGKSSKLKTKCDEITLKHVIINNNKIPIITSSLFYNDVIIMFKGVFFEKNISYIIEKLIYDGYKDWYFRNGKHKVLNEWTYEDGINLVKTNKIKSERVNNLIQLGTDCVRCDKIGIKFLMTLDNGCSLHFDLYDKDNNLMNIDHILPKSKGGKNNIHNYQLMCEECNSKKGSTIEESFIYKFNEFINKN